MRKTVRTAIAVATVLSLSVFAPLRAAEPFYERRLEEGLLAYSRDDYAAAVQDLQIACFGLLGEPAKLAACRTHLALAEAGAGDRQAFAATAEKILNLERRLQAYSRAELTQETRRLFEERLRLWVPAAPSVTDEIEARIEEARALLASSRDRPELERTFTELSVTANQRPEHRELQQVVAEIGYRLRRWQDAVTYFQRGGVSESEHPERRFYYAVALYEIGEREAAVRVLELCLPRLQKTEFVRDAAVRILGQCDGCAGE